MGANAIYVRSKRESTPESVNEVALRCACASHEYDNTKRDNAIYVRKYTE